VFFGVGAAGYPLALAMLSNNFAQSTIVAAVGALVLVPLAMTAFGAFPAPKQAQGFPIAQARGLFATARVFDAAYAEKIGLVTEVVADAAALDAARDRIAREIMACGPLAVAGAKELVSDVYGRPIDHDLMDLTAHRIAAARVGPEGQEGVRAFLERRRPAWAEPVAE